MSHMQATSGQKDASALDNPLLSRAEPSRLLDIDKLESQHSWKPLYTQSILLTLYLALGVGYCHHEGLCFCDGLYFVIVTLFTVGFGDFTFKSQSQKLFGALFIFVGVCFAGFSLANLVATLAAKAEDMKDSWADWEDEKDEEEEKRNLANWKHRCQNQTILEQVTERWKSRRSQLWKSLNWNLAAVCTVFLIGTTVMMLLEGWTWIDAFYFCMVTATTVGYGDDLPSSCGSKMFVVFYILVGFYVVLNAMKTMTSLPLQLKREEREFKVLMQFGDSLQENELAKLLDSPVLHHIRQGNAARSNKKDVTRAEFMLWLLIKQRKLDKEQLQDAAQVFDVMDTLGNGVLSREDLQLSASAQLSAHPKRSISSAFGVSRKGMQGIA